jgi:hypothetical protein
MEWLILLFLAPAIVVPVVLLFGFAGCSYSPVRVDPDPDPPLPVTPPTVTADPKNVDHITVTWQNTDPRPATKYRFVRIKGAVTEVDLQKDASITSVEDTGLDAATDYTYQVSTTTADGTSDPTTVTPSTFQPAFQVDPVAPTHQPGFAGDFCYVQRIRADKVVASGGKVGIKVRGAIPAVNHQNVTINRIYISRVAGGGNLWDSAGDLTPVMTVPLTLQPDEIKDLDPIVYNLDESQDLIVAFDFTAAASADTIRVVSPQVGVTSYFKAGVQQASVPTRQTGYSTGPSQIYLVVTIGVP